MLKTGLVFFGKQHCCRIHSIHTNNICCWRILRHVHASTDHVVVSMMTSSERLRLTGAASSQLQVQQEFTEQQITGETRFSSEKRIQDWNGVCKLQSGRKRKICRPRPHGGARLTTATSHGWCGKSGPVSLCGEFASPVIVLNLALPVGLVDLASPVGVCGSGPASWCSESGLTNWCGRFHAKKFSYFAHISLITPPNQMVWAVSAVFSTAPRSEWSCFL